MLREKHAYKVARTLLKDYALECITEEVKRRNLPHSLGHKVQAETFREISNQTEDFANHWAQFPARGLIRVKDLEGYVKRKLVAAGDFKDLRKKKHVKVTGYYKPHFSNASPSRGHLDFNAKLTIPRRSVSTYFKVAILQPLGLPVCKRFGTRLYRPRQSPPLIVLLPIGSLDPSQYALWS